MSISKEYSKEQLNYFRICYATTDILTEGLREIFKQEWDKQHKLTKGEWKDEPPNGMDFYNGESARNQTRNTHLLTTMKKGNRKNGIAQCFSTPFFSPIVLGAVLAQL